MKKIHLIVKEVINETPESVRVVFNNPQINYEPGQFLTIACSPADKEVRRAYSLCSSPHTDTYPAIALKRVQGGQVSNWICDNIKEGQTITGFEPIGHFTAKPEADKRRHFVMIGGGSGITPLFSMIKSVLKEEPQSIVSLIYGNRNEEQIMFKKTLEEMSRQHPGRLRVVHVLSRPAANWQGPSGRLTADLLKELVYQLTPATAVEDTLFYLCGPSGMMETAVQTLTNIGVKGKQIHRESFTATIEESSTPPTPKAETEFSGESQVTVIDDGDEYHFTVPADELILEAGLDAGHDMPYSCQSGVCTACRGKITNGKATTDEADALTDAEIQEGYVLTCVAKALTPQITIELG